MVLSTLGWTEEVGVTHDCLKEEAIQTEIAADLNAEQALEVSLGCLAMALSFQTTSLYFVSFLGCHQSTAGQPLGCPESLKNGSSSDRPTDP